MESMIRETVWLENYTLYSYRELNTLISNSPSSQICIPIYAKIVLKEIKRKKGIKRKNTKITLKIGGYSTCGDLVTAGAAGVAAAAGAAAAAAAGDAGAAAAAGADNTSHQVWNSELSLKRNSTALQWKKIFIIFLILAE